MTARRYILAIDQGTTGSRAIIYNSSGKQVSNSYQEFRQYYPQPGWVEHDSAEIWESVQSVIAQAIRRAHISPREIQAIGITNQRETITLWNRRTGHPYHKALVWQDRRTAEFCRQCQKKFGDKIIREKTGLVWDAYFSASKIRWLLDDQASLKLLARRGEVLAGTMDAWLLWNLTGGKSHATDFTNASRTQLFNLRKRIWDQDLLDLFKIPSFMLPEVKESGALFGKTKSLSVLPDGIPIHGILGDQQAALYGQSCYEAGQGKNTYGTGCFIMLNLGIKAPSPVHGLLTTLACDKEGKPTYALEGAIFIAGAAIQWLRDGLSFFKNAAETEKMICHLKSSEGVTVIPAFVGLGSPHWNSEIRGQILGITRGTTKAHIIRATLESIAHQTADVLDVMTKKAGHRLKDLRVDGGMIHNRFLMQFQADLLRIPVLASERTESTAWGVAKLAGRKTNFWKSENAIEAASGFYKYHPKGVSRQLSEQRKNWQKCLRLALQNSHGTV